MDARVLLVERVTADAARPALDDLSALLKEAVDEGAGVSFLPPFALAEARAYWESVIEDVAAGRRALLVAREGGRVVGTAQLVRAGVPNGTHRAEVQKVLVSGDRRRRGIARRLLEEVERVARAEGVTLLVLDTGEGNDGAERLYEAAGYSRAGVIPRYWRNPRGELVGTVVYYRELA